MLQFKRNLSRLCCLMNTKVRCNMHNYLFLFLAIYYIYKSVVIHFIPNSYAIRHILNFLNLEIYVCERYSVGNRGCVVCWFGNLSDDHLLWHLLSSKVRIY